VENEFMKLIFLLFLSCFNVNHSGKLKIVHDVDVKIKHAKDIDTSDTGDYNE